MNLDIYKTLSDRLYVYLKLMRLDKPIGIFLLLWPTLIALWIAGAGKPNFFVLSVFVLGVIVMRSAGCVINDVLDRRFDQFVTRTQHRPIASGLVKPFEGIGLSAILFSIALVLVYQLNAKTILFSVVGAGLAAFYPLMKRYTHFPQVVLGLAFGWAVPMAFVALKQPLSLNTWLLYGAVIVWAVAYDTEYAMVDRADDIPIGIKSLAIFLGEWDRLAIAVCQGIVLSLLGVLGWRLSLDAIYYAGLTCAGGCAVYQQYLIRNRDPSECFKAFLNNHIFGFLIWVGLALSLSNVSLL